jgi:DNA-directed RNA polymerase subunit RPC12/RpoP
MGGIVLNLDEGELFEAYCGYKKKDGSIMLCQNCAIKAIEKKSKILAYRTAWENELEFLKDNIEDEYECSICKNKLFIDKVGEQEVCNKCKVSRYFNKLNKIKDRISELTSALKILETK